MLESYILQMININVSDTSLYGNYTTKITRRSVELWTRALTALG